MKYLMISSKYIDSFQVMPDRPNLFYCYLTYHGMIELVLMG